MVSRRAVIVDEDDPRLPNEVMEASLPLRDVREFGTVDLTGNTDTSAVIQAADTQIAVGHALWFPPGIYRLDTGITKSAKTVWQGVGNNPRDSVTGSRIRFNADAATAVTVNAPINGARGIVRGIRFDYMGPNPTTTTSKCFEFIGTSGDPIVDHIIEDCYVVGFGRGIDGVWAKAIYMIRAYVSAAVEDGVHLVDSSDCWLIHSQTNGNRYGLYALRSDALQIADARPQVSGNANVYVEDTNFFKMVGGFSDSGVSAPAGNRYGLHLVDCEYPLVDGVTFYSNGTNAEILVETMAADTSQAITITGCVFHGFLGAAGVKVRSAGTTRRLTITGNVVNSSTTPLVEFEKPTGAGTIDTVTVTGNSAGGGVLGAQHATNLEVAANPTLSTLVAGPRGQNLTKSGLIAGSTALVLSGASGERASCPDTAGISIVGDICVVARFNVDWTPAALMTIASKLSSTGNQRSWEWQLTTTGFLNWIWSTDGTATVTKASTANLSALSGWKWIAIVHDVDNGAAGNDVGFWTSDDGSAWTQLGATVTTAGVTSIFDSTAELAISGVNNGTVRMFTGSVSTFSLRSGHGGGVTVGGTEVAAYDPSIPFPRYRDEDGNLWTVNGAGHAWASAA